MIGIDVGALLRIKDGKRLVIEDESLVSKALHSNDGMFVGIIDG